MLLTVAEMTFSDLEQSPGKSPAKIKREGNFVSDLGELFNAMKEQTKSHRKEMLARADVTGWTQHTEWHYSRTFKGKRMEWWPSGGKAKYDGRMIYGHRKVNALIEKLKVNL